MIDVDKNPVSVNIQGKVLQCRIFRVNMTPEDNHKDMQLLNKLLLDNSIISLKEQFVAGKVDYWLVFVTYEHKFEKQEIIELKKDIRTEDEGRGGIDEELLAKIKQWRNEKCKQLMLPAYMILHNKTTEELAKIRPTTYENLDKI